jgi:hypothetical protein
MPIDIEYLRNHEEAAIRFVQSQDGLILNIVARAVAATRSKIHGGHLIIHSDMENPTGGFIVSPKYKQEFEGSDDYNFSRVAGLLAEMFFCNAPSISRSLRDLGAIVSTAHPFNPYDRSQNESIQYIHQRYRFDFGQIAPAVQSNYYLTQRVMSLEKFIIDKYHVIPSCVLDPFCGVSPSDKVKHYLSTHPSSKRTEALEFALQNTDTMLPNIL